MLLYRRYRYRALALVTAMVAVAALGTGAALAEPPSANTVLIRESHLPPLLVPAGALVRPPAETALAIEPVGLTAAAIIRPVKEKNFALALVAGRPAPGKSHRLGARPSIFKSTPAMTAAPGSQQPIQWVLLADSLPAAKGFSQQTAVKTGDHDTPWHYAVEMIYMPVSTMSIRAALSMAGMEEEIDEAQTPPAWNQSRIGVTIGLGLQPRNGVLVDVDYARVMKSVAAYLNPTANRATHPPFGNTGHGGGEEVISVSLSISF